jgi:hypothetical protein
VDAVVTPGTVDAGAWTLRLSSEIWSPARSRLTTSVRWFVVLVAGRSRLMRADDRAVTRGGCASRLNACPSAASPAGA